MADLKINKKLKRFITWIMPHGLYDLYREYRPEHVNLYLQFRAMLEGNKHYKNLHQGERCFILCNGPSVGKQNLLPLRHEIVFSVSMGYYHHDYHKIKPRYHCVPQLPPTDMGYLHADNFGMEWFRQMHSRLHPDAAIFLNYTEEPLVRENDLFPGRKINYLCLGRKFDFDLTQIPDLTKVIPKVQTAPIMCLMIAMYMGFRNIYLLGADHDFYLTGEYKYAFKEDWKGKDPLVDSEGKVRLPLRKSLCSVATIFEQYHTLYMLGQNCGINIFNATLGGALDELPRVVFEDVVSSSREHQPVG